MPVSCPKCATPLEAGARFCGVCGNKLADMPAQERSSMVATAMNKPALKMPL